MTFKKMLFVGMIAFFVGAQCSCAASAQLDADRSLNLDRQLFIEFPGDQGAVTVEEKNEMLFWVAKAGNVPQVLNLLAQKADVDAVCSRSRYAGQVALHIAAQRGHADTVFALLAARANVDIGDAVGRTALHKAAQLQHYEVVQILINNGASAGIIDNYLGSSVLDIVARQLKPTVVSAVIDAHINELIKRRPITQARAVHLKENLILWIESAARIVMEDWEENGQNTTKNEFQETLNLLQKELANAQGLDIERLLRGKIICNGQPRLCMTQIGGCSESDSELFAIDLAQKVAKEQNPLLGRAWNTPGVIEEGGVSIVTDVAFESDVPGVDQTRNIGRTCAVS